MTNIPPRLRTEVVLRAGDRCEYCKLSQLGQEAMFHVDSAARVRTFSTPDARIGNGQETVSTEAAHPLDAMTPLSDLPGYGRRVGLPRPLVVRVDDGPEESPIVLERVLRTRGKCFGNGHLRLCRYASGKAASSPCRPPLGRIN